jgi:hypothetical protein
VRAPAIALDTLMGRGVRLQAKISDWTRLAPSGEASVRCPPRADQRMRPARPPVSWAMLGLSACATRPIEILRAPAGQCPSSSGPWWRLLSWPGDAASIGRIGMSGSGNRAFASLAARLQPPRRRASARRLFVYSVRDRSQRTALGAMMGVTAGDAARVGGCWLGIGNCEIKGQGARSPDGSPPRGKVVFAAALVLTQHHRA